jgi:hypothetical protein
VGPSLVLRIIVKFLGGRHVQQALVSLSIGNGPLNLEDKLTHTPTYQKGETAIQAHEKIGMGEVKIHSVLLRDQLILRLFPFQSCCCGIDCLGSTFFLALG